MSRVVRVAVEGCCHGELRKIYAQITALPKDSRPELLLICGDFQSLRSKNDFYALAVPDKYKRLGDFASYYNGENVAPVLTIFIGGNHEASNFLNEMQYGGWVAPKIYYMGLGSVVWFKGLRIGGVSGIYNEHNFYLPRLEKEPFRGGSLRSVYHTRFAELLKMSLIRDKNINCFMSHDWPEGIVHYGDVKRLLKIKPFFKADIEKGELGSPVGKRLLKLLMPNYWFSAHLHVKFQAVVRHEVEKKTKRKLSTEEKNAAKKVKNDEIDLDLDSHPDANNDAIALTLSDDETKPTNNNEIALDISDDETKPSNTDEIEIDLDTEGPKPPPRGKGFSQTNFLALDKIIRGRQFMEFLEIPVTNEHISATDSKGLYYDQEWIKILKWFESFKHTQAFEDMRIGHLTPAFIEQLGKDVDLLKIGDVDWKVPKNFEKTKKNPGLQTEAFEKTFGF